MRAVRPTIRTLAVVLVMVAALSSAISVRGVSVREQLRGSIVRSSGDGRLWYVEPRRQTRYLLEVATAAATIRRLAVRMSAANLTKIPPVGSTDPGSSSFRHRYRGFFVIEANGRGRLWYVDPNTLDRRELPGADFLAVLNDQAQPIDDSTLAAIPTEQNLDVPFVVQAPLGVWDADHNEFCEEASVLMAVRFLRGRGSMAPTEADRELQRMKRWELRHLGYHFDTGVDDTARILREVYGLKTQLSIDPSARFLREIIDTGHPMLVPVAGRMLHNPHFRAAGPDYHMLVIRGYTSDGHFIVNDPGTSFGSNVVYRSDVLLRAMHDYNGGDVEHGRKAVIIPTR